MVLDDNHARFATRASILKVIRKEINYCRIVCHAFTKFSLEQSLLGREFALVAAQDRICGVMKEQELREWFEVKDTPYRKKESFDSIVYHDEWNQLVCDRRAVEGNECLVIDIECLVKCVHPKQAHEVMCTMEWALQASVICKHIQCYISNHSSCSVVVMCSEPHFMPTSLCMYEQEPITFTQMLMSYRSQLESLFASLRLDRNIHFVTTSYTAHPIDDLFFIAPNVGMWSVIMSRFNANLSKSLFVCGAAHTALHKAAHRVGVNMMFAKHFFSSQTRKHRICNTLSHCFECIRFEPLQEQEQEEDVPSSINYASCRMYGAWSTAAIKHTREKEEGKRKKQAKRKMLWDDEVVVEAAEQQENNHNNDSPSPFKARHVIRENNLFNNNNNDDKDKKKKKKPKQSLKQRLKMLGIELMDPK